jgi:hypothetical protein
MTIAPTSPTPAEPADPGRALALRQVQRLDRLAEMAMEQAEAMHAEVMHAGAMHTEVMDPVPDEPGKPDPAETRARVMAANAAFQRQARVVAQITAVQSRIARVLYGPQQAAPTTPQTPTAEDVRKQWRKRRVDCIVEEAIAQCEPGNPLPLVFKLKDRLRGLDPDLDPDFQDRPLGATVALICRGLGLKPDWSQWAHEDWALAEARDQAPGSPYAEPQDPRPSPPDTG